MREVVAYSCSFLATKNGKIATTLIEGVSGHLPDRDLDEGQSKFPDTMIDEYKSTSCCLFLVLFLQPKKAKLALSEGVCSCLPDHVGDLDESQSEFPDTIDEYENASCCLFLVLLSIMGKHSLKSSHITLLAD